MMRVPGKPPNSTMTGPGTRCGENTALWPAFNAIRAGKRTKKSPFANCSDCHRQDPHRGQFGKDCQSCHVVDGFEKVSFNHDHTRFPLTGKHAAVSCQKCHPQKRCRQRRSLQIPADRLRRLPRRRASRAICRELRRLSYDPGLQRRGVEIRSPDRCRFSLAG